MTQEEWIIPSKALPHPDIEVLIAYRHKTGPDMYLTKVRAGNCHFNRRGERYWSIEDDEVIIYPATDVLGWIYIPDFPK